MCPPKTLKKKLSCEPTKITYSLFRYVLDESDGSYQVSSPVSTNWVHIVMVYHGVGGGITCYEDGIQVVAAHTKDSTSPPVGNGIVVIGRRIQGNNAARYASTHVDDLKFYNYQLSEDEICKLY